MRNSSKYEYWKNIVERITALGLLLVLSPLLLLIGLIIILDSPGNPLFIQERIGKGGRVFRLYKFRSMHCVHDDSKYHAFLRKYLNDGATSWLENGQDIYQLVKDPRITRAGSPLRATGLDELPQLINVIRGEMALIGPRPDIPYAVNMYKEHHKDRLRVRPGITGLWQVSGRRSLSFDDMVKLDVDYINRQSLALDARILLLTVREMLSPDRAAPAGEEKQAPGREDNTEEPKAVLTKN
jgi:lipopolysaccharide/colanic/teichoic acid biosynthesis glycosyltransferase